MDDQHENEEDLSLSVFNVEEPFRSSINTLPLSKLLDFADQNDDSETYIYLNVMVFLKLSSVMHLERGAQCAERWCTEPSQLDQEQKRRLRVIKLLSVLDSTVPTGSFLRESSDFNIAVSLREAYTMSGSLDDLSTGFKMMEQVVEQTSPDHHRRAFRLVEYATYLSLRFQRLSDVDDLHKSIRVSEEAMEVKSSGEIRALILGNLATCLLQRIMHFETSEDIDRAVEVTEESLSLMQDKRSIEYSTRLGNLGCVMHQKYLRDKTKQDIDRAIECTETAIDILKANEHVPFAMQGNGYNRLLYNAGSYLRQRYTANKDIDDLNNAITRLQEAEALISPNSITVARIAIALAECFSHLYDDCKSVTDLEKAAESIQRAIQALPEDYDHPTKDAATRIATELGSRLESRFEMTGDTQYLTKAIHLTDMSVKSTLNQSDKPRHLRELARLVARRYLHTGQQTDLDYAADLARAALDGSEPKTLDHADAYATLGMIHDYRFRLTNDFAYLDDAIEYFKKSIKNTPKEKSRVIAVREWSLSTCTILRYKNHDREMVELDQAINLMKTGIGSSSIDEENRNTLLINLAVYMDRKYELSPSEEYAACAISTWKSTIATLESQDPHHVKIAGCWFRLSRAYLMQASHDPKNIDAAISAGEACGRCDGGPSFIRIAALALATSEYANKGDKVSLEKALACVYQAIDLYPAISFHSMKVADKLELIKDIMGVGHFGAAIAVLLGRSAYEAVRLFESGRGIVARSFLDMRMDISNLEAQHPMLASKLASVQAALDTTPQAQDVTASINEDTYVSQGTYRSKLEGELRDLLRKIRENPGFENFLGVPSEDECLKAAAAGPIVIINPSTRMHAFLIQKHGIDVIELRHARMDEMLAQIRTKATSSDLPLSVLEWIWDAIAEPVLKAMKIDQAPLQNDWPHVHWITGGQLCYVPIHAAGTHVSGSGKNVIDRVVSSYSFSLTTLINSRGQSSRPPTLTEASSALLVSMPKTPGADNLPYAEEELDEVERLCTLLGLASGETNVKCREKVLFGLGTCKVFHFAGHGHVELDQPARSGLRLEDDILTLGDILSHDARKTTPWLSYLSACSTGESVLSATPWVDEGLNLINAFQLAGFRHVIGTLWEVGDSHCVDIARTFYESLLHDLKRNGTLTDSSAAFSLHKALTAIRTAAPSSEVSRVGAWKSKKTKNASMKRAVNTSWWPYVHFGP